ncbi:MAG TPA: TlpA disulfide reductase family protein [Bryobacteraceae bacterium]|nr:TlpA disulfide reductase family protein [Bryobacteraceae bacterium]
MSTLIRAGAVMLVAFAASASLVNDVRVEMDKGRWAQAEREVAASRAKQGDTPEVAAALSWLARGALDAKNLSAADQYAVEARKAALAGLKRTKLDDDPWLPVALGASMEVHAQVLHDRGKTAEAVAFLQQQLKLFGSTSLSERIEKNLNLLNLVGKPAPRLEETEWIGRKPPALGSLKGHAVLLFFWAHWCPDCKAEARVLGNVMRKYASHGLELIGPTKLYGYAAGGEPAAPASERKYIEQVKNKYYAMLADMPVPVSSANFRLYGASTTPTLVLVDRAGIVRLYHPGTISEDQLSAQVEAALRH